MSVPTSVQENVLTSNDIAMIQLRREREFLAAESPAVHMVKCWPDEFEAVASGHKRADYRFDDRGFKAGDTLTLEEWDPDLRSYTGRTARCRITHVTVNRISADRQTHFGIPDGYCLLSIAFRGPVDVPGWHP